MTRSRSTVGRAASPIAFVVALAGCVQEAAPPDQFFRISAGTPALESSAPLLPGTLEVERLAADGLLAGRSIAYTSGEPGAALMEYRYEFWDKPPGLMVQDELVRCMERGRIAERVVTERTRIDAGYALTGRLLQFERVEGTPSRAVVEIRLGVRNNADGDLVLWNTYTASKDAADDTMSATVAAFGEAISDICARLTADLTSR